MFTILHHADLETATGGADAHAGEVAAAAAGTGLATGLLGFANGLRHAKNVTGEVMYSMGPQLVNGLDITKAVRGGRTWGLIGLAAGGLTNYALQKRR